MSKNKISFERSALSKIKGFKDLNLFDDFIQTALDKFNFSPDIPKLDESAEKFHDYILDQEPQIPDLIIYNKTFNKNECFSGYYTGFNKYPRKKFVLNAKERKEKNHKEENDINQKDKQELENNEQTNDKESLKLEKEPKNEIKTIN